MVLSFATALSNSGIYFYYHAVAYETTQKARAVTNIPFSFLDLSPMQLLKSRQNSSSSEVLYTHFCLKI